jgi:hypothetical protein
VPFNNVDEHVFIPLYEGLTIGFAVR